MSDRTAEVQRILTRQDPQFQQWKRQHEEFEHRLEELARKATLSIDEEVEEKRLKKKKLSLKDQMAEKIRVFSGSQL